MSGSPEGSTTYTVVYSGLVRDRLRELLGRAIAAGRDAEFVAALSELNRRLHVYPQFGEPSVDLKHELGQIWRGTVPPLVVRYAILEERRIVFVAQPPALLPNSGFGDDSEDTP
jgi:hypothetical protein